MLNAINQFSLQKIADSKCIVVGFAKKTESNWIIHPVFFLANFNELPISLSESSLNQNNKKKCFAPPNAVWWSIQMTPVNSINIPLFMTLFCYLCHRIHTAVFAVLLFRVKSIKAAFVEMLITVWNQSIGSIFFPIRWRFFVHRFSPFSSIFSFWYKENHWIMQK